MLEHVRRNDKLQGHGHGASQAAIPAEACPEQKAYNKASGLCFRAQVGSELLKELDQQRLFAAAVDKILDVAEDGSLEEVQIL